MDKVKKISDFHKEIRLLNTEDFLKNNLLREIVKDSYNVRPIKDLSINSEDIYKDIYKILDKYRLSWIESYIVLSSYLATLSKGYINKLKHSQIRNDKKDIVLGILQESDYEIIDKLPLITQRMFLADGLFCSRIYSDENMKGLVRNLGKRFDILNKFNFTCVYCGRKAPEVQLQVDHIIPKSLGGSDDYENLTCSCWDCNLGKSNKLLNNYEK